MRYGLIGGNAALLLVVLGFIIAAPLEGKGETVAANSIATSQTQAVASPLDSLSSSEIAATAAQLANLPEATAITNQAESDNARLDQIAASSDVTVKPQVVASNYYSNKDIKTYVVLKGDTLASVAKKFSLDQDTLRWSNDLSSDNLSKGQKLLIPPVNGIVYTVKSGDTASSIADKYNASETKIIAYNDAELSGLKKGERIIIPGGEKPAPVVSSYSGYGYGGLGQAAWGLSAIYGYNGYDYGYCTWYVANQIPVPANWGNASTWAYYAERTPGWNVSATPVIGSIAQNSWSAGGQGHVAIVEAISGDQVKVRDMNGLAGWGRVGVGWESIAKYQHFIYQ